MKFKIFFCLILVILGSALFADKFVVRIDNPDETIAQKFIRGGDDIASYKPSEYLDIVVNNHEYEQLTKQGFNLRITQTTEQLRNNLNSSTDLAGYRDYNEMLTDLQNYAAQYPEICELYDIGNSRGKIYSDNGNSNYDAYNHEIWALKVSDNVSSEEDEPNIYYLAEHHAREPISLEVVMYFLDYI